MNEEKEYTERDMRQSEMITELRAENKLLKQILEQKLDIELIPKLRMGGSD